jgi:acetylornithine/N-succinyldiaminopimelate aminotransferase
LPGFSYADFNNLKSFEAAVTDDTIAVMVEPVQGEGGVIPATDEFLRGLRKMCDEKGLLLLFDEIQTGWCRTGSLMAYMSYGVKPDVVSMAKAMGGGMPISAVCATKEAAKAFTPGSHGTTYGGNPVCCAAAYAQITEMIAGDYAAKASKIGAYFMEKLKKLPNITEVRGRGLLVGIELKDKIAVAVKRKCLGKRLLLTAIGDKIIRMVPPLIASEADCDKAYEIISEAIAEIPPAH